ncbi:unnamed protein product [Arabis nemorensis]|uniref:KEN domain-containing protein n=1 Tax=Arabis nemorensis TaxID=586526 RepID=A0A565BP48_9BRAS|nr:unnamed protein product [Arabis nemorensis]
MHEFCPMHLLAAIRNSYVHFKTVPQIFKTTKVGSNAVGLLDYFDRIFPSFFIEIYEHIYKNKKAQEELTTYF